MVLSEHDVMMWLGRFLWPFLRITGLFLTAPLFNSAFIPRVVKLSITASYAVALALWLPTLPRVPDDILSIMILGLLQIVTGALMGFVLQIAVSAVACAGELVGLSIGLGFAELQFREATSATPVLYDLMFWGGLIGYLVVGGPIWLFAALAHSFQMHSEIAFYNSLSGILAFSNMLITSSLWIALPVMIAAFCVNIIVAISTVFAPQMNLLTVGFPILILTGLYVFALSLTYFHASIQFVMNQALLCISAILPHD